MTSTRKPFLASLTRDDALTAAIALAVSLAALVMASITPAMFLPAALASSVSALLATRVATTKERPVWPAILLLALGAWSALQALPLPLGWVERLSPAAGDVWARCLVPFGGGVRFASISVDPAGSLFEAEKFLAYGCVFFAASRLAAIRGATRGVLIVAATGVAVAVVTLAHSILRIDHVYGLYAPRYQFGSERIGPFLNTNNLAGFMNLAIFAGLGLVASRRVATSIRWAMGVGLVATMAVAFSTASRGGLGALVVGAALLAVTLAFMQRSTPLAERDTASIRATLALLTLAFAACAVWFGTDPAFRVELVAGNAEKLKLALATRPMIGDFPWFGIGRGAFESTFDAYRPELAANVLYTHPENFLAQWITEWGVVVAPFALGALAFLLRPTRLGFGRSNLASASFVGVSVLLLQNLADLGLELAGTSVALFALLGTLHGAHTGKGATRSRAVSPWPARVVMVGAVAVVVLAVRPLFGAGTLVTQSRERVRTAYFAAGSNPDALPALREALRVSMARHPSDAYFPMVGAMNALRSGDGPVIPFVQRALERGPHVGRTHLVLAEALTRVGARSQALLEIGLAVRYDGLLVPGAARLASALTTHAEDLLRITPNGANGPLFLVAVAGPVGARGAADARDTLDREALRRDPSLYVPRQRLMATRLDAMQQKVAPCADPSTCRAEVEAHAAELARLFPLDPAGPVGRARLATLDGKFDEADRILADACKRPNGKAECLRERIQVAMHVAHPEGVADHADLYEMFLSASCTTKPACAAANDWLGGFHEASRNTQLALSSYEQAAREEPTPARWSKVADAAERAGSPDRARIALEKARSASVGPTPGIDARLEKLRLAP